MRKTDGVSGVTVSGEVKRLVGDKADDGGGISIGFEYEALMGVSVTVLAIVWYLVCDDNAVFSCLTSWGTCYLPDTVYLACDPNVRTPQLTFFFSLDVVRALTEGDFCTNLDLGNERCKGASNLPSIVSC